MRLQDPADAEFRRALMKLGDGVNQQSGTNLISIPLPQQAILHTVTDLILSLFPHGFHNNPNSVRDHCILAAKNDHVNELNELILRRLPTIRSTSSWIIPRMMFP